MSEWGAMISDEEIDALVEKGWSWHAAYRHLQSHLHNYSVTNIPGCPKHTAYDGLEVTRYGNCDTSCGDRK